MNRIQSGCECLDKYLGGGISPESITLIYGEPETGKTTIAMQCAINCALQNRKTLFIDCDHTFSSFRLAQITSENFKQVANLILLLRPIDFKEQTTVIDNLSEYTTKNFGLIIIDTFTSLYRANLGTSSKKIFVLNRELNRQLAILAQNTKLQKLPIIITSQVRSVFGESYVCVEPVATRVLKFWADTIISLKPTEDSQMIKAEFEKTPNALHEAYCTLRINGTGIHNCMIL
ncbi:MAG: AAA family ATPase [Candidatus Bathyarchaeota archaeon]|nr:AAA family ATPase [Candidatus Bathyarchaeota archaeon]